MQNNQNFYRNGYQGYNNFPTSSRNFQSYGVRNDRYEHWHDEEDDWSTLPREDTWRGDSRRNPGSRANEDRRRYDSWKSEPSERDFQLGRDRAPMPITDDFLDRYGAKRLNNGNLVDRNGYTLRTRDPDCRAFQPSPPGYNPRREVVRGAEEKAPPSFVHRLSEEDLEKFQKARQQIEMMNRMATERKENPPKNDKKRERKRRNPDEGEDEYEDVEEPIAVKEAPIETPTSSGPYIPSNPYYNNIKKTLLTSPHISSESPSASSSSTHYHQPSNYQGRNPRDIPYKPSNARPNSWYHEYKQHVETVKEQAYRPSPSHPASSGYFFKSQPSTLSTSSGASTTSPIGAYSSSTSSPYYATTSSAAVSHYHHQNHQNHQNLNVNPFGIPKDVAIPDVVYPPSTPTPPGATSRYANQYLNGMGASSNQFGVWNGDGNEGIKQLAQAAPPPPPPPQDRHQNEDSSDSDSEDEAMTKLRQIIANYGTKR